MSPLAAIRLILLFVVLLGGAGCGGGAGPSELAPGGGGVGLEGTSWAVRLVGSTAPVPGAVPTITFADGKVSGSGGCNGIGATYELDPATGRLATLDAVINLVGCPQAIAVFENRFFEALSQATAASMDASGQLVLAGRAGQIVLVRNARPAPACCG